MRHAADAGVSDTDAGMSHTNTAMGNADPAAVDDTRRGGKAADMATADMRNTADVAAADMTPATRVATTAAVAPAPTVTGGEYGRAERGDGCGYDQVANHSSSREGDVPKVDTWILLRSRVV
jgi:hypothetical protein